MAGKKNEIAAYYRSRIVSGEFKAGDMLPFRTEVERRFKASPTTVNEVFSELKEHGFIEAKRNTGTKVVEFPPHLFRFGVAFGRMPEASRNPGNKWGYFYESLDRAVKQWKSKTGNGISIEPYYGIDWTRSTAGYKNLCRDIENDKLAGVLFAEPPFEIAGAPILKRKGLPRIAFAIGKLDYMPTIYFSAKDFLDKGMTFFFKRGRRKVAILFYEEASDEMVDYFEKSAEMNNIVTHPRWQIFTGAGKKRSASSIVRLLFDSNQREIPDALIIADDHLVEGATEGILKSGVNPENLDSVAYSNFPAVPKTSVNVTRIGFDCHELLTKSIGILKDMRDKREIQETSILNSVFEADLNI